jgi:hypothetical protein
MRAASAGEIGRIELRNAELLAPDAVATSTAAHRRAAMNLTISRGGRIRTDGFLLPKQAL